MADQSTITREITVDADRDTVFRALTESNRIESWWTTEAKSEPRRGGRFLYTWEFPETPERDHEQRGTYESFEPGEGVGYPWSVGEAQTRVRFEVSDAEGEGTRVRLEHTGWDGIPEDARQQHDQGWQMFLGNLKSVLEGGADVRAEAAGMRVKS